MRSSKVADSSCHKLDSMVSPRVLGRWSKSSSFLRYAENQSRWMCAATANVIDVPVLIVGAGPVGLILSILLAKLGIQSLTIDKKITFSQHPQAHFINNRTMEIFRKIGTLSEDITALQPPIEQWSKFLYCSTLTGPLFGVVDHLQSIDLSKHLSPTTVAHFSQHRLVQLLCKEAERHGISINSDKNVSQRLNCMGSLKLGYECVSLKQSSENVEAEVLLKGSDKSDRLTVNSKYVVGADGAASKIRRLINVKMEGDDVLQNLISIHFNSKDLAQHLIANRPGMLYFVFNTEVIGVLVAHDLRLGEFIVQVPFYPPQQSFEDFTSDACKDMLFALAGVELLDIDIKTVKKWVMHAQVANRYISQNQRIILAGDAAHCFPPAGGFGMNTGIQDAHNLAWKLAAVVKGIASENLISTYETERQPIAKANTTLSIENYKAAMSIPSVLGLDPLVARFIHKQLNKGVGSLLPQRIRKSLLNSIFALGQIQVSPFILNEYNPIGTNRLQKLKHVLEDGQSLQLLFLAEDLGFRYRDGALYNVMGEKSTDLQNDTKRTYEQVCKPGVRLPHLWVRILGDDLKSSRMEMISTLDLNKGDSLQLLAFVGPNASGQLWGDMMLHVAKTFRITLKVVVVWPLRQAPHESDVGGPQVIFDWVHNNGSSILQIEMVDRDWWELCAIPCVGAILVRPDDHVAWVSIQRSTPDSVIELQNVFTAVVGKHVSI